MEIEPPPMDLQPMLSALIGSMLPMFSVFFAITFTMMMLRLGVRVADNLIKSKFMKALQEGAGRKKKRDDYDAYYDARIAGLTEQQPEQVSMDEVAFYEVSAEERG